MALVVGATGLLGFEICRQLRQHGTPVAALVRGRSPTTAHLEDLGAQLVFGDLKDRASLETACAGQPSVVSTANSVSRRQRGDSIATVDRDGHANLLAAARARGVRRFVFTSVSPNAPATNPLIRAKRAVESLARASGLAWINLQAPAFIDIWLSPILGWDLARGRARVIGAGTAACSYIAVADVAAFAVAALTRPELENRDLAIGGPEALTATEVVAICEQVTGRRFTVQHVPVPVLRVVSAALRPFAPIPSSLMDMGAQMATRGDRIDSSALAADLGIRLTSVREYVARVTAGSAPPA
ncbi:MAG: SDR family oxidoreductase [Bacteroidales bacterium]